MDLAASMGIDAVEVLASRLRKVGGDQTRATRAREVSRGGATARHRHLAFAAFAFLGIVCLFVLKTWLQARRTRTAYRALLVETYKKHAPDKLGNVDAVLDAYRGNEEQLAKRLRETYRETGGETEGKKEQ